MLFKNIFKKIANFIALSLKFLIWNLRPLLGSKARCKFTISCTDYAMYSLKNEPLLQSIKNITIRVLSCW